MLNLEDKIFQLFFKINNLVPALPVLENVTLPLRLSGKSVDSNKVRKMLESLNFKAELSSLVATLSGGEQQKSGNYSCNNS